MMGEDQQQAVERAFSINTHQLDLARQQGYELQVGCAVLLAGFASAEPNPGAPNRLVVDMACSWEGNSALV